MPKKRGRLDSGQDVDTEQQQWGSIAEQFVHTTPSDFRAEIEHRKQAVNGLLNTVAQHVEQRNLTPLDGARIASCIAGTVFGYEEFHGASSDTLVTSLMESGRGRIPEYGPYQGQYGR